MFDMTIYNDLFVDTFSDNLVTGVLNQGKYSKSNVKGSVVEYKGIGALSTYDYDETANTNTGNKVYSRVTETVTQITIDKFIAVSTIVTNLEEWKTNPSLMGAVADEAAKATAIDVDVYNLTKLRDGSGDTLDLEAYTPASTTIIEEFWGALSVKFDENKVPVDRRIAFVTPQIAMLTQVARLYNTNSDFSKDFGYQGDVMDIRVYKTDNLPANANTPTLKDMIGMDLDSYAFVSGLKVAKIVPLGATSATTGLIGDGMENLYGIGGKVLDQRSTGVIKISFDETPA